MRAFQVPDYIKQLHCTKIWKKILSDLHALPTIYIFLDEGGNFDFSSSGTKYFTLTCVTMRRPFLLHTKLDTYKYDLIEHRIAPPIDLEHFHACEDNSHIRANVFDMLGSELPERCVDVVVVEKSKTGPALQPAEHFYPRMLGYLLRHVLNEVPGSIGEVVIITDSIPVAKKRKPIEKSLKTTLKSMLPKSTPFRVMHHASKAHYGLQIADYLNWAVFRKWERNDAHAYSKISHLIRSEFEIFRKGTTHYYDR